MEKPTRAAGRGQQGRGGLLFLPPSASVRSALSGTGWLLPAFPAETLGAGKRVERARPPREGSVKNAIRAATIVATVLVNLNCESRELESSQI